MVVSFCIKEPLDFTRVHQIELKFSKFPGGGPPHPPMGGGNPLPYQPPIGSAGSISKPTGSKFLSYNPEGEGLFDEIDWR